MKNLINTLPKTLLLFTFISTTLFCYAQPPWCDTCVYHVDLEKQYGILDSLIELHPLATSKLYPPCPESDTGLRYIGFIHGLDGSQKSWADAEVWTSNNYKTNTGRPHYVGWDNSFNDVAYEISKQITSDLDNQFSTTKDSRCYNDDYIIGHSQGGIGTRYLDYKWDKHTHNSRYGDRRTIHGLVTIGSTNGGADIGLTKAEHAAFVTDLISTIVLHKKNELVYNLASKGLGKWISNKFYEANQSIDKFIEYNLVPLALQHGVHAPTLDELASNSPTMDTLRNHPSKMHKLAFYGVETEPECWRVVDNIVTKAAEDYDAFAAVDDDAFKDTVERVRAEHAIGIQRNFKKMADVINQADWKINIDPLNAEIRAYQLENKHRENAILFLNNANTQWRYLIGSYHRDSFDLTTRTKYKVTWEEKYGIFGKWFPQERKGFDYWWDAQAHYNNVDVYKKRKMQLSTYTTTKKIMHFYPSDGVALCKSQVAFPGAPYDHKPISNKKKGESIYEMFGNNHFQERNSPQTKQKLEELYRGKFGDYWIVDSK